MCLNTNKTNYLSDEADHRVVNIGTSAVWSGNYNAQSLPIINLQESYRNFSLLLTILIMNNYVEFATNIMYSNDISFGNSVIVLSYSYGSTLIENIDHFECNCWIKVNNDVKMTVERYVANDVFWYTMPKLVKFFGIK